MKRLIPAVAVILGWASAAWPAAPATLTTLRAIHVLTNSEAAKHPPVAFEATVTYRRAGEVTLFVQDGDSAIWVAAKPEFLMASGDRVLIKGIAQESFRPIVIAESVTVLGHGSLPKPLPVTFEELLRVQHDCMRVVMRAQVRSADVVLSASRPTTHLVMLADGSPMEAFVNSSDEKQINQLVDAEVEVVGVAGITFDGKTQRIGVGLSIPTLADIKILRRAETNPWALPETQMDEILDGYLVKDLSRRVRIHGTITYFQPASALVLQSGEKSIWVATKREEPLRVGSEADVTGFPDVHNSFLALANGEVQQSEVYAPIAPRPVTRSQLTSSKNIFDLVSTEGRVETETRQGGQDQYILVADGQVFSATYRHPVLDGARLHTSMKQIPVGSRVRVSGICTMESSNPFERETPFDILMRTPDDIVVTAPPSRLNTRNLLLLVGLLLVVVFAVIGRGWALERKMRRQTAVLSARTEAEAEIERQRSRILEDINGTRPLVEILEEIAAMVSATLEGAPCWCMVADGERLGSYPQEPQGLRIVQAEIPARSGPALGTFFAGLDPCAPLHERETIALHNGTRLATLAIETRRLYSDLRRRSEFDLLTDIPNRFAMETFMNLQIEEARQHRGNLGLIYIDLDKFKPINDMYGHHVGDLYLQAVALRMSRQLLGGDMLARLGGDEFAALVSLQHGRADLDKILGRLESCFDEPFSVEGILLHGEASIGFALYPEDGETRDNLLRAADAAMYVMKNNKKNFEKSLALEAYSEPVAGGHS
ncbi:MAG: GGDEF domain-containing protein [Terracidiphilus sp.]|jgi:diguanylate cyclase (GGDEF)-like protein